MQGLDDFNDKAHYVNSRTRPMSGIPEFGYVVPDSLCRENPATVGHDAHRMRKVRTGLAAGPPKLNPEERRPGD